MLRPAVSFCSRWEGMLLSLNLIPGWSFLRTGWPRSHLVRIVAPNDVGIVLWGCPPFLFEVAGPEPHLPQASGFGPIVFSDGGLIVLDSAELRRVAIGLQPGVPVLRGIGWFLHGLGMIDPVFRCRYFSKAQPSLGPREPVDRHLGHGPSRPLLRGWRGLTGRCW